MLMNKMVRDTQVKKQMSQSTACINSTWCLQPRLLWGVGIYSWQALGPLLSNEHCLNATADINIIPKWVHPFLATFSRMFPKYDSDFS